MTKNTLTKNILISVIVLSGLAVGGGILYYMNTQAPKEVVQQVEHKKKPQQEDIQQDEKKEEVNEKNINEKRAIETLERKETEIKNDDAVKQITDAIKRINDSEESLKPNVENHLSLTNSAYLSTINVLLQQDYKLGNIKMYNSKHDNVLQFVFTLDKEGAETIAFAGNYVPNTEQIEIANMKGDLPTGGSSTHTKQYVEKESDKNE